MLDYEKTRLTYSRCRFSVYTRNIRHDADQMHIYSIVLKDEQTGIIFLITDLADYVMYKVKRDSSVYRAGEKDVTTVCAFLNRILIDGHDKYGITSVSEITVQMVQDYLDGYSATKLPSGDYPSQQSCRVKRAAICTFLETLAAYGKTTQIRPGDLIDVRVMQTKRGRRRYNHYINMPLTYHSQDTGELKQLWRDMPLEVVARCIRMAMIHDPELVFPIVLMSYVGLRGGEVCNVYRGIARGMEGILISSTSVKLPDGTLIKEPEAMEICLKHEFSLRTDDKTQGDIKKERLQDVFPPFLGIVTRAYYDHLKLIKDKPCEIIRIGENDIEPMFLNQQFDNQAGVYRAMTISGLRHRVSKIFYDYVLPSCENDAEPELQRFYLHLQTHTWGKHAFRHFYTVLLLFCGVDDPQELMDLRGDKRIHSAETYLKHKGYLLKLYRHAVDRIGEMIGGAYGVYTNQ